MGSFLQSVYAQMLRGREIDRSRKVQEKQQENELTRVAMRQMLEEQRLLENAKQAEFDRHSKVAAMEARSAALKGEGSAPTGYFNPAVAEMANAAFGGGQVEREAMLAERSAKRRDQDVKMYDANLDFRSSQLSALGGVEKSGYGRLTPEARETYLPALADPSQPIPGASGPLTERVPESEIMARSRAKAGKVEFPEFADLERQLDDLNPRTPGVAPNVTMSQQIGRHAQMRDALTAALAEARKRPQNARLLADMLRQSDLWKKGMEAMGATEGRLFFQPGAGTSAGPGAAPSLERPPWMNDAQWAVYQQQVSQP